MKQDATGHAIARERPYLLVALGSIGLAGCGALIIGTFIAPFFVPDYNWISDTISDLAAGHSEIIMDIALYGFAAGLMATALAASHAHLGGISWSVGVLSLAILASLVVVVGARNEYGDSDTEGVAIHIYLVYGLGIFFLLAPLCMARGVGISHGWAMRALFGLGVLWGISAPIFFLLPTSVDGIYERALGLIACAIVGTLCAVFLSRGRRAMKHA